MAARKATDDEIRAALDGRTVAEAAQILGMHERNVYTHKARLARQGWSPEHDMTAKDAYSAWGGYRAQQNMKCIIHHAEFGEVGRHTVNPNMLKGEVAA